MSELISGSCRITGAAQSSSRTALFFAGAGGIMVFGAVLAVLGTVLGLPQMCARLHVNLAQVGTLFLLLYVGMLVSNLVVGPLLEALGHKPVLLTSALLVAAALLWFSAAHSFWTAAGGAIVLGLAGGALNTGVNTLVSEIYLERRGSMLNLLGVFHGAGALFIPLFTVALAAYTTIPQLFMLAALIPLACAAYYVALKFPPPPVAQKVSVFDTLRAIRYPSVLIIGILLFFEAGNEAVIGSWTSIYGGSIGLTPRAATLVLACYWAMIMIGRALAAKLLTRVGKPQVILAGALAAAIGCSILMSSKSAVLLGLGAAVIGVGMAPIFLTALGIAGDRNQRSHGSIYGLLFAMAMVGAMSAPWAVGQISQRYSLRYGPWLPLVGSVVVAALAVALWRGDRRRNTIELKNGPRNVPASQT